MTHAVSVSEERTSIVMYLERYQEEILLKTIFGKLQYNLGRTRN